MLANIRQQGLTYLEYFDAIIYHIVNLLKILIKFTMKTTKSKNMNYSNNLNNLNQRKNQYVQLINE